MRTGTRASTSQRLLLACTVAPLIAVGCVKESHRTLEAPTVASHGTVYQGPVE